MKISYRKSDPAMVTGEILICLVSDNKINQREQFPLSKIPKTLELKNELYAHTTIYDEQGPFKRYLFMSIGKEEKIDKEKLRRCAAKVTKELQKLQLEEAHLLLVGIQGMSIIDITEALSEGFHLASYQFDRYKSEDKKKTLQKAEFISNENFSEPEIKRILDKTELICRNTNLVRDLVNESSSQKDPVQLGNYYYYEGKKLKMKCTMIEPKELAKLGMNLLLAVGKGSPTPPRLIILEYWGNPKSQEKHAIIGKGVTFDTGGVNLKPTGSMEEMRLDMGGSATVYGIIKTAAELKLPINIIAAMPLVENAIDGQSYKCGDVYKAHNGKFVHISNTDAEGRLILADTLSYIEKKYTPKTLYTFATLTGAVTVALGSHAAGLMNTPNAEEAGNQILRSGQETYERAWRLPLFEEYKDDIKSDIADLKTLGYKSGGMWHAGTIIGGLFLTQFVENTPYVHIDIAATAWIDRERDYVPKYATGWGVRLMTNYFERLTRTATNGQNGA